ncbi:hypothetical protein [Metapseudomonas resinovorans]|uniref:Uncharacterized protein n=1 Tax=Metapseudomonas resinovorans NBRC 106553 TaxID=1245471 RepID=S6AEW2_METRE|nr:hypothetical protein [Pseudomonas resinovorans]BAN48342.1 hypothetical protein PCA10_26100 [Pseudomonas resinovorans NBRC 106553]
MLQPRTPLASPPAPGPLFDCASPFASIALVQPAHGERLGDHLGDRLQRCLARLFERRKTR